MLAILRPHFNGEAVTVTFQEGFVNTNIGDYRQTMAMGTSMHSANWRHAVVHI